MRAQRYLYTIHIIYIYMYVCIAIVDMYVKRPVIRPLMLPTTRRRRVVQSVFSYFRRPDHKQIFHFRFGWRKVHSALSVLRQNSRRLCETRMNHPDRMQRSRKYQATSRTFVSRMRTGTNRRVARSFTGHFAIRRSRRLVMVSYPSSRTVGCVPRTWHGTRARTRVYESPLTCIGATRTVDNIFNYRHLTEEGPRPTNVSANDSVQTVQSATGCPSIKCTARFPET